ncbi:VWA domain-containing protein [Candidatus Woesearchaeota archaeon]|nr:VWA domain-containing protein [Candidatus Woesearchaeota archaeon]
MLFLVITHEFVRFGSRLEQESFVASRRRGRFLLFLSRVAVFSLLIAALAGPFDLRQAEIPGNPELNIFADRSVSFGVFDTSTADSIASEVEKSIPVNVRTIAEANRSALGDMILANIRGDDNVLLVTDGNNNYGRSLGDVILFASSLNTTISAVSLYPVEKDAAVFIDGPSETTADADNEFVVSVASTGVMIPFMLRVSVDDELVLEREVSEASSFAFTSRLKEGYHRFRADISADDRFRQNNRFLKAVKVQPKPKVLFVSQKVSPSAPVFSELYDVTVASSVPSDIRGYAAVIINDVKLSSLPVDRLSDYVLDGNGLFVIGGKSSFDRDDFRSLQYKPYEALLPVVVGTGKDEPKKDVNVIILVDVSGSTGSVFGKASGSTVEEVEKALAVSVLRTLKPSDRVGVIAFESIPHKVSDIQKLSDNPDLEDRIARISYGRGTDIGAGISAAIEMLAPVQGSKSIILISDGIPGTPAPDDVRMASSASAAGIRIYAVGVGERTNTRHMQDIAAAGRGAYFEPKETEKLKIVLGESEKANASYSLDTVNNYHFITRNLRLKASVSGHNFVLPKSQAQLLVATASSEPILTVWRLGLGRVAVLSTDDGSSWGGDILSRDNSGLLSRSANWVIGDLGRAKDFDVDMDDVFLGEDLEIFVKSRQVPAAPNLNFSKIGENAYVASYTPKDSGFYEFFDSIVAVNYQKELREVGMNRALAELVSVTGGVMFEPGDVQGIVQKVRQDSKRIKSESNSYSWILAAAAIGIFLLEVAVRRAMEIRRSK